MQIHREKSKRVMGLNCNKRSRFVMKKSFLTESLKLRTGINDLESGIFITKGF